MATLQTIRDRGGLLVSIVIGVSLLAFIVGDALSSGSQILGNEKNQIGQIAGEDISIMDYQNEVAKNEELVKMMNGLSALNEEQQTMLRNNTWQKMIMEKLLNQEYEALGLTVGNEELYDILLGENISPFIRQQFTDPNTGVMDIDRARMTIRNIIETSGYSRDKAVWLNMEKEAGENRKSEKYNALLAKSLFTTDVQAEENVAGNATKTDISYIVKNYSTIDDSTIQVSNSEIKDYYNKYQQRFTQTEARRIAYVNFDIEPSGEDFTETKAAVEELVEEFTEASDPIDFVNLTSDQKADQNYYKKSEIANDSLADFLFSHQSGVFGPYMENNAYKISRIAQTRMLPDSVRARHILIAPQNNNYPEALKVADSLANLLRKGANFEQIARENSADQNSAINGGDLGWFDQKTMVQPFSDTVFFAQKNEIKVVLTQFGAHVVQVTDRAKPVEKIQIATIEKEIIPSTKTTNAIYNNARTFASNIASPDDFNKQVEESNLIKRLATVDKNEKTIAGMTNARDMIRQIYLTEEPGMVYTKDGSIIFENGNTYTVAILTEIDEEGISPLSKVAGRIKQILIQKKKAELLEKELNAAKSSSESLLSIAQKTGTEVKEANDISFNTFQIPGAGIEPKVIAAAVTLPEGEISAPIAGNQGVYLVVVNNISSDEITPEMLMQAKNAMQQANNYRSNYQALQAILKNGAVKDQRYKFY